MNEYLLPMADFHLVFQLLSTSSFKRSTHFIFSFPAGPLKYDTNLDDCPTRVFSKVYRQVRKCM